MAYFSTYFRWLSVQRFCRTAAYANVQRDESTASFSFAEALKSLKTENDAVRGRSSRHGLWIAVAVYVSFALPDRWLIPDVAPVTIAARFVVATIALLVFETLRLAKAQTVWLDVTCASALLAGYVGWLYPAIATRDVTAMSYYMIFGAIFMMGANLFSVSRFGFR